MNFLLDPKLRQLLIDQLDADGHYELATKLEQLPAIIPQTQYEIMNKSKKVKGWTLKEV